MSFRAQPSNVAAVDGLLEAIEKAGFKPGKDSDLGLDVASSEFYAKGKYNLHGEGKSYTSEQFADYLAGICAKYPVIPAEDGCAEGDWTGWKYLTEKRGNKVQLVGYDLFVTTTTLTAAALIHGVATSTRIKHKQNA